MSKIKLLNNQGDIVTIEHSDTASAQGNSVINIKDVTKQVDTIADLKLLDGTHKLVYVTGYHTKGDGAFGSHFFEWDATSIEADNGGTIIKLTSVTTGRYKLRYNGAINIKWFNPPLNGIDDDTSYFIAADTVSNGGTVLVPYTTGGINVSNITLASVFQFENRFKNSGSSTLKMLNGSVISADYLMQEYKHDKFIGLLTSTAYSNRNGSPFKGITFIGDSITRGTYNSAENTWSELLEFAFSKKFRTKNIGFEPVNEPTSTSIHNVVSNGTWVEGHDDDAVTSWTISSNTANDTLTITPTYSTYAIRVGYVLANGDSCSFKVIQNGVTLLTVSETGTTTYNRYSDYTYTENKDDAFEIEVVSGTVSITGIYYIDNGSEPMSLKFAKGGRSLSGTSDKAIDEMLSQADGLVICSLGYNDKNTTDATDQATRLAKLDRIADICVAQDRPLIINDFIWQENHDFWLRKKYIEISKRVKYCKLFQFPSLIKKGSDGTTDSYRINTLKLFNDSAHPNNDGYRWVFGIIKKVLGLSDSDNYRNSLVFTNGGVKSINIQGTGNKVYYMSVMSSATLSEVGNKTGRLVLKMPFSTSGKFFMSFSIDIWTYPVTRVGTLKVFLYWDGSSFVENMFYDGGSAGLSNITLAKGTLDGNAAIAFGADNDTWGYPTVTLRDVTLSFSDNAYWGLLQNGITSSITTSFVLA